MDIAAFRALSSLPIELSPALQGLWHDRQGNWDQAHECVQEDESRESAWVHAYLHRKEGDISNAGYWYRRAAKPVYGGSLETEWEAMVRELLGQK